MAKASKFSNADMTGYTKISKKLIWVIEHLTFSFRLSLRRMSLISIFNINLEPSNILQESNIIYFSFKFHFFLFFLLFLFLLLFLILVVDWYFRILLNYFFKLDKFIELIIYFKELIDLILIFKWFNHNL